MAISHPNPLHILKGQRLLYVLLLAGGLQMHAHAEPEAADARGRITTTSTHHSSSSTHHSSSSTHHTTSTKRHTSSRTTSTSTAHPIVTKFQGFDSMPTGRVDPSSTYNGLQFYGWSVEDIDVPGSYFNAESPVNALRLIGNSGTIAAAPGLSMNTVQYYFGCAKGDAAADCQFANIYPGGSPGDSGRPNTTFNILYDGSAGPANTLIQAEGAFAYLGPNVTFAFSAPHEGVNLYIDSFVYVETGCT